MERTKQKVVFHLQPDRNFRNFLVNGKRSICHITNGAVFSTFKRTDSHAVRGRPTRKDGVVIYERLFRNGSFRELKIAKES